MLQMLEYVECLTGLANVGLNMWNIFPHAYSQRASRHPLAAGAGSLLTTVLTLITDPTVSDCHIHNTVVMLVVTVSLGGDLVCRIWLIQE